MTSCLRPLAFTGLGALTAASLANHHPRGGSGGPQPHLGVRGRRDADAVVLVEVVSRARLTTRPAKGLQQPRQEDLAPYLI